MIRAQSCDRSVQSFVHLAILLPVVIVLSLLTAIGPSTASAQSRENAKREQAMLQIQATIVSMVTLGGIRGNNGPDLGINFNFPPSSLQMSTTEGYRYVLINREHESDGQVVLLRTISVTPK